LECDINSSGCKYETHVICKCGQAICRSRECTDHAIECEDDMYVQDLDSKHGDVECVTPKCIGEFLYFCGYDNCRAPLCENIACMNDHLRKEHSSRKSDEKKKVYSPEKCTVMAPGCLKTTKVKCSCNTNICTSKGCADIHRSTCKTIYTQTACVSCGDLDIHFLCIECDGALCIKESCHGLHDTKVHGKKEEEKKKEVKVNGKETKKKEEKKKEIKVNRKNEEKKTKEVKTNGKKEEKKKEENVADVYCSVCKIWDPTDNEPTELKCFCGEPMHKRDIFDTSGGYRSSGKYKCFVAHLNEDYTGKNREMIICKKTQGYKQTQLLDKELCEQMSILLFNMQCASL